MPLYAIDYARRENDAASRNGKPRLAERCWFSHGGICSNFPIHLFDSPLTTRPNFGVNLEGFPVDLQKRFSDPNWPNDPEILKHAVRGPHDNAPNRRVGETWNRFDSEAGYKRFSGILSSIFGAAQTWQDNALTRLPGYRDRIVGIRQGPGEGGINLDMDAATIQRLGNRGAEAGKELAELQPAWWSDHRWVRYRSIMGLLETFFDDIKRGLEDTRGGALPEDESEGLVLDVLLRRPGVIAPDSYKEISNEERFYAVKVTRLLLTLCREWKAAQGDGSPINLGHDAPRPHPSLRVGPDW